MTPPLRLDHCVIAIADWERSNAFYRDVLGAEIYQPFRDPDGSLLEFVSYAE